MQLHRSTEITSKSPKTNSFWQWFLIHEHEIFDLIASLPAELSESMGMTFQIKHLPELEIWRDIAVRLRAYHENIEFHFGNITPSGKRKLILTCRADKHAIPALLALSAAAPNLHKFEIVEFCQRDANAPRDIIIGDMTIKATEVHFCLLQRNNEFTIQLLLQNVYEIRDILKSVGKDIFIIPVIGEYQTAMYIDRVTYHEASDYELSLIPSLVELRNTIDKHLKSSRYH